MKLRFECVNLADLEHCSALILLLNEYMQDEMGMGAKMNEELAPDIINGLKEHSAYLGFFVRCDNEYVGLANCNRVFSTWQAKPILNIHDFIVHAGWRNKGVGLFLMNGIKRYSETNGYCKINLEVREDNNKALALYNKAGFKAGNPPMLFWEFQL